ncbi:filamentous hemagglutinin [Paucimonas lemoignei]|uniref:Filamentous hemagglutinin n=1 Tax=Paucimonas lemoignei TaxID=29443 RepID=A0A4R3HQ85_PAULE|nr:hemagglutinin repeat-containing protein [Paucimonas lemoignei]TCS32902.1 filamentous hemagglutinin [Paucimonas lemoignei]
MKKPSQVQPLSVIAQQAAAGNAVPVYVQPAARPWVRHVARAMATLLLCQGTLLAIPAVAQITPSANAPAGQRPIMDAAQNGVPIVHIAPPSAGGVSRNQYNQFNVGTNGAILNNSATAVQTQQGGWITGNLQLGPTPARIILNEVVGANPSQLRGTIEVAGQRANIVVANPNGITCDGCGFLNTGRASLTTGQTQFNTDGSIRGFDVRQGQVTVGGNGLNATNLEQLDLIARGIVIEGEVWAKNLNAIAGANQVLYGTLQAAAQAGSGPAPSFAIDIKDLGGMYANQIYLVSNELGIGVNSTGRMAALQGNLVLSANGDLTLKDTYAKQDLKINGGNIALNGQTQSEGKTTIAATGNLSNSGTIDSHDALALDSASLVNGGTIAQRNGAGVAMITTGTVTNSGIIYSGGQASIQSATLDNRSGMLVADQGVAVQTGSIDNTAGQIGSDNAVTIATAGSVKNTQGKIVSNGSLALAATTLNNQSGIVSAQQAASVQLGTGLLDNTQGQVTGSQALALQTGEIRNRAGTIASGGGLALNTQGAALTNTAGGQIVANGDLSISSARLDNTSGTAASINGQLHLNTGNDQLVNDSGKLQAASDTTIAAANTSNQNGLITGQNITATTGTWTNDGGQVVAGGTLALSTQALSNQGGLLQSVGNTQLNTHGQALTNSNSGNAGGIIAGGTLTVHAGSLNNQAGFIASNSDQTLNVTGDLDNRASNGQAGQLVSNGNATLSSANVFNQGGQISTLGNVSVTTGTLDNRAGTIGANGDVAIAAATINNAAQNGTAGTIDGRNITATVTTVGNQGGAIRASNDATLTASSLDNAGGTLTAKNNMSLASAVMANATGRIVGDQAVTITTSSQTLGGTVASSNNVTLNVNGDYSNSSLLSAQKDLTINANNITNSGTLTAGQTLTANTGNLTNSGEISGQNVVLNASGTLTNTGTGLIDATDTRVNANTLNNTGRIYGDTLRIKANTINNDSTGAIAARGTLLIGAQTLNNTNGGLIYSLGDMAIGGTIDGYGQAQGSMASLTNASSKIESAGNMVISSATILNRNDNLTTAQVADAPVYQERVQPNGSATQYSGVNCYGIGGGQDDNGCIVHPDKYGQRSAITPVFIQDCHLDPNTFNQVCTTQASYAWNDPVFARFGVAPVNSPPPVEPAGGCSYTDPNYGQTFQINSPACNQWRTDYSSWNTAYQATLNQLDPVVSAYNAEVNEDNRVDHFEDYTWYRINSTQTRTVVTSTAPGQILAGGNMSLTGSVTNRDSQIVAGGALAITGPAVNNLATQGEERTDYSGTAQFTEVVSSGFSGHKRKWYDVNPYNPAPVSVMVDLPTVTYQEYAGNQAAIRTLANGTGMADATVASAVAAAVGNNRGIAGRSVQAALAATTPATLSVPNSSLFVIHAEPSARYLVETDPRFTNYRNFISSDYFLQTLNRDPERQLKRYGDGFMEQQLVNDQILALTGRRYLAGYTNTEDEYKALMDSGVAFAKQYQLTPGVALTAEQMALLTTDIVWLTTRTVTLADGSTQDVLVPQVYLRRPANGDLQSNGALIAGNDVLIQTSGNLTNSGTIAGKTVTAVAGNDLVNQGGRISGQDVFMRANNDLKNLSGVIQGTGANSTVALLAGRDIVLQTQTMDTTNNDGSSTRSSVQRIATVQGGNVQMQAVRDLVAEGAAVKADDSIFAAAGRDIKVATVAGEYQLDVQDKSGRSTEGRTGYISEAATRNQGSMLTAGSSITMVAANDLSLKGSFVDAGSDGNGNVLLQGRNVSIEAAKDRTTNDVQTIGKKSYSRNARDNETLVGGAVTAGDSVTVRATSYDSDGAGNITLTGANIAAQKGSVALVADKDITIQEAATRHTAIDESYVRSDGIFTRVATTKSSSRQLVQSEGSSVSGDTIAVRAGNDLTVRGSTVAGDGDVTLAAGNNLTIAAATSTSTERQFTKVQENGFLSGGGFGINYGQRITTTELNKDGTTQSGQERSLVGSNQGSLNMVAGDGLRVSGSDVAAAQDINMLAKRVTIDEGRDTSQSKLVTKMEQDALSLSIGGSVVNAIQTMQEMEEAASRAKNTRTKALAAATAAMAAANAAQDIAQNGVNVSISLTYGHSEREMTQTHTTSDAIGSTVAAGNNLNIVATGAGKDSNITIQGSDVAAGKNVTLAADNRIDLLAAQDLEEQHSKSKSMNAAAGIAASAGTNGMAFGVTASVGLGRGQEDGSGVTQRNTHVNAGNTLILASGGDTTLKGAVASGKQVIADIGGNLNIESLQDTAKFDSKNENLSVSATVGFGASVSASYNKNKIHSDYASVQEQSGIAAGDGGFDIRVKGNTDLKGGVIASTQAAVEANRNSLVTGTLTQSDLENHATFKASGIGLSGGFSVAGGDGKDPKANGEGKGPGGSNQLNVATSSGAKMNMPGVAFDSGSDSSVTRSGISAGNITITDEQGQLVKTGQTVAETVAAINRNVATGMDTSGRIANNFDKESVEAGLKVVSAFSKEVGTYISLSAAEAEAKKKAAENPDLDLSLDQRRQLLVEAKQIEDNWGPGGTYRQVATALAAAASGNVSASGSQFVQAAMVNYVQQQGATYIGKLVSEGVLKEGSPEHAALHAIVACAGAAASNQNCGAGAAGAAASSFLTNLFSENPNESNVNKENKRNLVASLVAGIAAVVSPENGATAVNGAIAATDNNWLHPKEIELKKLAQRLCAGSKGADVQACGTLAVLNKLDAEREAGNNGSLYKGITKGVTDLLLSPVTAPVGLINSVIENGATDTAINIVKGVAGLPKNLYQGLTSEDSEKQGQALVEALALGYGTVQVAKNLAKFNTNLGGAAQNVNPRIFNGVELDSTLPPPAAGFEYSPSFVKGAKTENQAYSHMTGYQAEIKLANEVAGQGQIVVKWGDKIGAHGSDIISINPKSGEVTLWDSKFRSAQTSIQQSPTFSNASTNVAAVEEARNVIRASDLPDQIKIQALQNLDKGNFITNTVGSGGAKNSVHVRYCGNKPC